MAKKTESKKTKNLAYIEQFIPEYNHDGQYHRDGEYYGFVDELRGDNGLYGLDFDDYENHLSRINIRKVG